MNNQDSQGASSSASIDFKDRVNKILSDINSLPMNMSLVTTIKDLLNDEKLSEKNYNQFFSMLGRHLSQMRDKTNGIRVITTIASSLKEVDKYLSNLLTILQSLIKDENADYFMSIASVFGEIVVLCKPLVTSKSKVYEILQGFCFYNIRRDIRANQACGSMSLEQFIKECPKVLNPENLKFIWENICIAIENQTFHAKTEVLSALKSLVKVSGINIQQFAVPTLYKIFDILSEDDWYRKKIVLEIIHQLALSAPSEIVPLKANIVEYLMIAKDDKEKEVRTICIEVLRLFDKKVDDTYVEPVQERQNQNFAMTFKEEGKLSNNDEEDRFMNDPVSTINVNQSAGVDNIGTYNDHLNTSPKREFLPGISIKHTSPTKDDQKEYIPPIHRNNESQPNSLIQLINNEGRSGYEENHREMSPKKDIFSGSQGSLLNDSDIKIDLDHNKELKAKNADKSNKNTRGSLEQESTKPPTYNNLRDFESANNTHKAIPASFNNTGYTNQPHKKQQEKVETAKPKQVINHTKVLPNQVYKDKKQEPKNPYHSILKGPKNQEFFNTATRENNGIQILSPKLHMEDHDEEEVNYNPEEQKQNHLDNEEKRVFPGNNAQTFKERKEKTLNKSMLEKILKQMIWLSNKQILLMDTLGAMQSSYQKQMTDMNKRIAFLENINNTNNKQSNKETLNQNNQTFSPSGRFEEKVGKNERETRNREIGQHNYAVARESKLTHSNASDYFSEVKETNRFNSPKPNSDPMRTQSTFHDKIWNEIEYKLKNKYFDSAFSIATQCEEDLYLLKLIERTDPSVLKEVRQEVIEVALTKVLSLITKGEFVIISITWIKSLLIGLNLEFNVLSLQSIKNALNYKLKNSKHFSEEVHSDMKLVIAFIDNKLAYSRFY